MSGQAIHMLIRPMRPREPFVCALRRFAFDSSFRTQTWTQMLEHLAVELENSSK